MRVGCAAYSYRQYLREGQMSLEGFLKLGAEMGLDGVELTAYYFPTTQETYLFRLKRLATLQGLDISATAVGSNFCHPQTEKRAAQVAMVKRWIDHSVKLGAPCIRVFAGTLSAGSSQAEAQQWTIESLKSCVDYAAKQGIFIALENHGGITSTADQVLTLVKAINSEWLGINLDTANFTTSPYEEIAQVAPYAVTVHAKTHIKRPEGLEEIRYEKVIKILTEAGYKGYLSIEYEADEDPMTAVPKFVAYLKRLVG